MKRTPEEIQAKMDELLQREQNESEARETEEEEKPCDCDACQCWGPGSCFFDFDPKEI
jgi:hypothetical protein